MGIDFTMSSFLVLYLTKKSSLPIIYAPFINDVSLKIMSKEKSITKAATKSAKASLEGVHPVMHTIKVVMSDKSTFEILTTWGKEGDVLTLDADPKNHPAWQEKGGAMLNTNNERVNAFNKKFGGFGAMVKATEETSN